MADIVKGYTFTNGEIVTTAKVHALVDDATVADGSITTAKLADAAVTSAKIAEGTIVNADINASAAIADTKLATISTTGKVANSATTATQGNVANAIVRRDASGNFSAGNISSALTVPSNQKLSFDSDASGIRLLFEIIRPQSWPNESNLEIRFGGLKVFEFYTSGSEKDTVRFPASADFKTIVLGSSVTAEGKDRCLLELNSTTRGFRLPRMTTTERNLINPIAGLMIFNSTTNKINVGNGATWEQVTSA